VNTTDAVDRAVDPNRAGQPDQSLQPWQFFVLAALACATAVTFLVRGQGIGVVILLTILMGTAALVGLAVLRTVRPLVTKKDDRTVMIGDRTRAALEREKMLAVRALKELEFDRAMNKISEEDFKEITARLRARALRLMHQLDAGAGYRGQIERELAKRLAAASSEPAASAKTPARATAPAASVCAACSTANDSDARFCKNCGAKL
jgi:hypothetical protein